MSPRERGAVALFHRAPPEVLFVISGAAQYSGAVVAVNLFDEMSATSVALVRVLTAGLILLAFSARRGHAPWTRRDLGAVAIFGIATALMNTFFYLAIERLPLGKGVTIEFIGPITVAALRTRTVRNSVALLLAAAGVVMLGGVELGNEPLGLLFIVLASLMWAGYIVLGSRVALGDRGVAGLGTGLLFGSLVVLPFGAAGVVEVLGSPHLIVLAAVVGMLSSAIGYGIDQSTMRRIPVRRFSLLLALLPVTAAVFGMVFLSQVPTTVDFLGMALVLSGVCLQERDERERHHRQADTP